jgi:hypothetical protein
MVESLVIYVAITSLLSFDGIHVVVYLGRRWSLDLQLSVQSVPITTNVASSNPVHGEVKSIQHYVIKFVSDLRHGGGFLRFPPPKLTDRHDITELLMNTINQPLLKKKNGHLTMLTFLGNISIYFMTISTHHFLWIGYGCLIAI